MTYLESISTCFIIIANIIIAVAAAAMLTYIIYRAMPRRVRCKITRWMKGEWK